MINLQIREKSNFEYFEKNISGLSKEEIIEYYLEYIEQHVVLDDKPHSSQWWRQKKDELTNIQKLLIQATELASFIQTSQKDQKPNESLANT